jgi:MYXO-CTERM domain-containing protein
MPSFTDLTGLAGVAVATAAAVLLLPGMAKLAKPRLALLQGAVFALMLIPFGALPAAAYLRGMTGDLSITTLVLLCCAMLRPWCGCVAVQAGGNRLALLGLIVLAALVLYPMALGAGAYDPYHLGYGNLQFVVVLLLLALAAWFRGYTMITLCIALATLAWAAGWYESDNLWDYLVDPFVAIYALASIMILCVNTLLKLQRGRSR